MSIAISALNILASSKPKSEGTLRGCVKVKLYKIESESWDFKICFSSQHFVWLATSLLFPDVLRNLTYVIKGLYFALSEAVCNTVANNVAYTVAYSVA